MSQLLGTEEWYRFFSTYQHSARRLEVRDAYASPDEDEDLRRFLDGEDDPHYDERLSDWTDEVIRPAIAAGKSFTRVRVVRDPPTPYQKFGLRGARYNTAAGEDIRYLLRPRLSDLHLPDYDFWVFDDRDLVLPHFTDADKLPGAYHVTAPSVARQHVAWLDIAWAAATSYPEFVRQHPTWPLPPGAGGG